MKRVLNILEIYTIPPNVESKNEDVEWIKKRDAGEEPGAFGNKDFGRIAVEPEKK